MLSSSRGAATPAQEKRPPVSLHIRPAGQADLPAIHALATESLSLDTFSPALLAEKLFQCPRQPEFTWETRLAIDGGRVLGFLQSVCRPAAHKAWLGLFATAPDCRRRGIATQLYEAACRAWPAEIGEIEVLAIPGNYFAPGLDPRYTEALCFLERHGFERFRDCVNLTADLSEPFATRAAEVELTARGVNIRRARREDAATLDAFFAEHFGADWRYEAGLGLTNDPPTLHLALMNNQIVGFSAHSTQNREWGFFGPMGTAPASRGLGVGSVLLHHCLNDLREAGHRSALIPWVGPIAFYQHWSGARVSRVFWRYRLKCNQANLS
jgi:GNAT superfamily N-acetyltransferase